MATTGGGAGAGTIGWAYLNQYGPKIAHLLNEFAQGVPQPEFAGVPTGALSAADDVAKAGNGVLGKLLQAFSTGGGGGNPLDVARRIAAGLPGSVKCFGKCLNFADEFSQALRQQGIGGTIIRLEKQGAAIGDVRGKGTFVGTDVHEAVQIGDTVFDNLNPNGVPFSEWRESLRFLHNPSVQIPDKFFSTRRF